KEEDAIVRASAVGGTSIDETLKIMDRTGRDDGVAFGHRAPCILVVGDRELNLKRVHVNVRTVKRSTIVNVFTQELGTLTIYVVDVADGNGDPASIEFSSGRNADAVAHGIDHLGSLCGASR